MVLIYRELAGDGEASSSSFLLLYASSCWRLLFLTFPVLSLETNSGVPILNMQRNRGVFLQLALW
jgi:hypothetical protein